MIKAVKREMLVNKALFTTKTRRTRKFLLLRVLRVFVVSL